MTRAFLCLMQRSDLVAAVLFHAAILIFCIAALQFVLFRVAVKLGISVSAGVVHLLLQRSKPIAAERVKRGSLANFTSIGSQPLKTKVRRKANRDPQHVYRHIDSQMRAGS